VDWAPFERFRADLTTAYPVLSEALEPIGTNTRSLLLRWAGRGLAEPTVLMAHYDVVAVGGTWTTDPFGAVMEGEGDDAVIRARGVIDDKASLVGILESVEALAAAGFQPQGDIYFAFSHNEEVLGDGTPDIVRVLESLGVRPRIVLDEGGIVGETIFPGAVGDPIQVGVSEKGTATVEVRCTAPGGHASVPPLRASTVDLAEAVVRIHAAGETPFLNDVTRRLILDIGRGADGPLAEAAEALAAGDEERAIERFSAVSPDSRAMVHSSAVVTVLSAGHTVNAVPEEAVATVNLRISVGDTVDDAVARLRAALGDIDAELVVIEGGEPSPVSPSEGREWDLLLDAIRHTYGQVLVSPYVNNGGTDSRNYTGICDTVYRFSPCHMTRAERSSIHAIDEHLRVSSFLEGCRFYLHLIAGL
jgi:carboxypeptidase PM20D1